MTKLTSDFIINNRSITIDGPNGEKWLMRQPTGDELQDAVSAYEMGYEKVIKNPWLAEIADNDDSLLVRQAAIRGKNAEALYIIAILIQDESGQDLFNMYDKKSRDSFEKDYREAMPLWVKAYYEIISLTVEDVKKK